MALAIVSYPACSSPEPMSLFLDYLILAIIISLKRDNE